MDQFLDCSVCSNRKYNRDDLLSITHDHREVDL